MNIVIQAVRQRENNVNILTKKLPNAKVVWDEKLEGGFTTFSKILKIPFEGYRLHLQDDAIVPNDLEQYLPEVEKLMQENDIHIMSLYVPQRKYLKEQYDKGLRFSDFPNFLTMVACVFSKEVTLKVIDFLEVSAEKKHDDSFIREFLAKHKIRAYAHFPSLVQHSVALKSVMKNPNTDKRQSFCFQKDFVSNFIKTQNEKSV
jgi:hypothetical protein